ncbi:hypothetical protein [Teichococcus aestuarii]|uniref:hypothetical protein n=1 Tax=Teichococcus aestuarii TaxID=568898 RepID=UPI0015E7E54D|nr:hypothetical protein [Pseudoroseomonas aestuarii]
MTEYDSRTYLAWSNTLTRTLRQLRLEGKALGPPKTLAEYAAERATQGATGNRGAAA